MFHAANSVAIRRLFRPQFKCRFWRSTLRTAQVVRQFAQLRARRDAVNRHPQRFVVAEAADHANPFCPERFLGAPPLGGTFPTGAAATPASNAHSPSREAT